MKMTLENKFKIIELTHDIRKTCESIECMILKHQGRFCFDSGYFHELDYIFNLSKKLKELNEP